jgi:SecD/SecF fusion protein
VREELRRGANMLTALRVGHDKAFSAILDGNMTTLIVCIVLAWFGTADVRGFGVTLGIGLVATLFTAVFMAHTILESYYRRFPSQKLQMLPLVVPRLESALQPRVQWMRHRRLFYTASVILSILGLSLCFARGADLFDIEFRSGTEVSFDLREGHAMSRAEVEEAMEDTALKGNATVVVAGETDEEHRGSEFSIITSETDSEKVSAAIRQAMAGHINVDPVIEFRGNDASQPPDGVIFPVHAADLGEVIGRSDVHRDISEFRGGVAIVLDQVRPSLTTDELRQRITATRLQPDFEGHQFRPFQVIGLEPDPSDPTRFMSLVVVSRDAAEGAGGTESGHEELASSEWNLVRTALTREQSFSKVSRFTPVVARTLTYNAIVSLGLGLLGILAYIWVRFGSLRYGLAAVVAVFHDVTIVLGIIAASAYIYQLFPGNPLLITPFKINMGMIAALLTVVGYSLNDTIVVFDRVRENRGKLAHVSEGVINDSVNQTLSRTLLTGVSTLMAILLLYILGREAIRGFAMAIFVGIVVGTYSSIGIASPLLLLGSQSGRPSRGGERSTPEKSPAAQR